MLPEISTTKDLPGTMQPRPVEGDGLTNTLNPLGVKCPTCSPLDFATRLALSRGRMRSARAE